MSGTKWTATSAVVVTIVQFVQLAVLARLLSPQDFGLMAMIMVVLGLAQAYSDIGISNAIIFRQDATADQLSSLYWLNIIAGVVVFAILVMATPLIVALYSEPRLYPLVPWAAAVFLLTPLGQQFEVLLQKELQFRLLAAVELGAALVGAAISVTAAFAGWGVFSLVFGQLGAAGCRGLAFAAIGWRRWPPKFHFQRTDLRGYLGFGLYQMGERTVNFLGSRADQLLIGMLLGPLALGYYSLAWNLVVQPITRINPILTRVAFPLFARVQRESARLKRGFMMMMWLLATLNAPLLVGCAATASILVPLLFGEKWIPAVPLVQILAFVSFLRSTGNPVSSLLLAKGRADLGFKWNLALLFFRIPGVYVGARLGGLEGVAFAVFVLQIFFKVASYPFMIRTLLGPCLLTYLGSFLPPLAVAVAMGSVVLLLPPLIDATPAFVLGAQIAVGAMMYIGLTMMFDWGRIREIAALLTSRS